MTPNDPQEVETRARMMVAVILSLLILFGFQFFFPSSKPVQNQASPQKTAELAVASSEVRIKNREEAVSEGGRISINGKKIKGSLSLTGARIDDLVLSNYYETGAHSKNVELLSPAGTPEAYYVEDGWLSGEPGIALPGAQTVWSFAPNSAREITSGGKPVVLQWNNEQGLIFEKAISLDDNYLFTVTQRVSNKTGKDVVLNAYHLTARANMPHDFKGFFVLHEGPLGFLGKERYEPQYKNLLKGDKVELENTKGWLGITDKYWLVALLPQPDQAFNARIMGTKDNDGHQRFQSDAVLSATTVKPGESTEETSHVYAGVKDLSLMQSYEDVHGFDKLELGIDFGMWYFITKPFYFLLHFLMHTTGSVAVSILLMTVIIRAAVFPLASKSFRSMAKMKLVAPKLKELQDKYKDDRTRLQMEIYELYRKEDVNPFSGCWPMFIQIPIFFALYKVILISVELRQAPFWGWIHDLSAPDPTTVFNLFGLIPWTPPAPLMIGAWPVLFCISMILQMRLSPPPADPTQAKIQEYFPYIVTVMMAQFASGLVIYWTWSNFLGTIQQYYILKKIGGHETSIIKGHADRRKKKHGQ